jgi:hypothetical protein
MSHKKRAVKTLIAIGGVVAMLAVPAFAFAHGPTDFRSADGTDGAAGLGQPAPQSLQSPDARDSAHATAAANTAVPSESSDQSDRNGWVLPLSGIVVALGLASGTMLVVIRRRHEARPTASA